MIDAVLYKRVLGSFPSGVTVVTTFDESGQITGFTASAFSAVSMAPPLVLICPSTGSDSYPHLRRNGHFAIHILHEDQQSIAYAFATKGTNKAAGMDWHLSKHGNAILEGAVAVMECRLWQEYDGGDHAILVAEVLAMSAEEAPPMLYCRGRMSAMSPLLEQI